MTVNIRAYIEGAFADLPQTQAVNELKEELCSNMIDKYNDLVNGGMTPQEAYHVVIDGIGDLNELRGSVCTENPSPLPARPETESSYEKGAAKAEAFPGSVLELNLDWLSGEIRLLPSDDGLFHIVEFAETLEREELFQATLVGDILTIRDGRSNFVRSIFGLGWLRALARVSLDLYIPEKELRRLRINAVSGNITGEHLSAQQFSIETVSGGIRAAGRAGSGRLKTTSGSVAFAGALGECTLEAVSGSLSFAGEARICKAHAVSGGMELEFAVPPESLDASVVSGRTRIYLPENDGFTLRFDKVSGRLDSDFAMLEQGGRRIYKDGAIPIRVNTVSGGCSLMRLDQKAQ